MNPVVNNITRIGRKKSCLVVGCSHSGTTLLIRLLGAHPEIYAIPEESKIFVQSESIDELKEKLKNFDRAAANNNRKMWAEKTPRHIHHVDLMNRLRPEAKIIAITRDPRDTACSVKARGFDFKDGLYRWIKANEEIVRKKRYINMHVLKLEDLTDNPDKVCKDMLTFLRLPYHNLLDYHKNPENWYSNEVVSEKPRSATEGENHNKLRNWQINQPIFSDTSRYKKDMTEADWVIFEELKKEIKPTAKKLGYKI